MCPASLYKALVNKKYNEIHIPLKRRPNGESHETFSKRLSIFSHLLSVMVPNLDFVVCLRTRCAGRVRCPREGPSAGLSSDGTYTSPNKQSVPSSSAARLRITPLKAGADERPLAAAPSTALESTSIVKRL